MSEKMTKQQLLEIIADINSDLEYAASKFKELNSTIKEAMEKLENIPDETEDIVDKLDEVN